MTSQLYSLSELEYRKLAKQVNQRIVRLEKYEKETGFRSDVLDIADYYMDYNRQNILPKGKKEVKRFPENPKKLSEEDRNYIQVQISNLLNMPLSQVSEVKKYKRVYDAVQKRIMEQPETKLTKKEKEAKDTIENVKRVTGLTKATGKSTDAFNPNEIMQAFEAFHKTKLDKIFGYRDIYTAITSIGKKAKINDVISEISKYAKQKRKGRKSMIKRFAALGV